MNPRLVANVRASYRFASVRAVAVIGALASLFLALPAAQQQALLDRLPVPSWLLPIASAAVVYLCRVVPQKGITPTEAEAKSARAPTDPPPTEGEP